MDGYSCRMKGAIKKCLTEGSGTGDFHDDFGTNVFQNANVFKFVFE